ncbi:thiamine-phosphate kinase [Microbacterium sp. NPDC091313]
MPDSPADRAPRDETVASLGEAGVLRRVLAALPPSTAIVGPGDDAAVIAAADGRVVATTDTLVHGPDFRLAWTSGFDLGWKSAAVNLADVAAMGARPSALLVALTLPDDTPVRFVEQFGAGLAAACAQLAPGCAVEGGDLAASDTLTVAVTALGSLDGGQPVLRSGARPGDDVRIVGDVGVAARGLQLLFRRFTDAAGAPVPVTDDAMASLSPDDAVALSRQLAPVPPVSAGVEAARAGAHAMMDVSDGLALDARRMASASGVTIDLRTAALGAHPDRALSGGEDHALLLATPAGYAGPGRVIGVVRERGPAPLSVDGAAWDEAGGWDPYRDWDAARG